MVSARLSLFNIFFLDCFRALYFLSFGKAVRSEIVFTKVIIIFDKTWYTLDFNKTKDIGVIGKISKKNVSVINIISCYDDGFKSILC